MIALQKLSELADLAREKGIQQLLYEEPDGGKVSFVLMPQQVAEKPISPAERAELEAEARFAAGVKPPNLLEQRLKAK